MSERMPDNREVILKFENAEVRLHPDTTTVYVHEGFDSAYDHVFYVPETDPEKEQIGHPFFREKIENFDEVLGFMRERGYTFITNEDASNFDKEMYRDIIGRDPLLPEPETYELTPRQERLVEYLGYVLETEQLVATDFEGTGDLYI